MKRPYWIRPAIFGPYDKRDSSSLGDSAIGWFTKIAWAVIIVMSILVALGVLPACAPLPQDPAVRYWQCLNTPPHSYVRCDEEERQRQQRRQS